MITSVTRLAVLATVALTLSATPAFAIRYATPTASNTATCAGLAHACSLTTAVNGHGANQPSAGEEIVVEPGSYNLPAPLVPAVRDEDIHGTGPFQASIASATSVVLDATVPTNLSTLTILGNLVDPGGTLDRLLMYEPLATPHHVGCQCTGGVLRDSAILGDGSSGGVVGYVGAGNLTAVAGKPITEDYRNDTILANAAGVSPILVDHTGSDTSVKFAFTAENVIVGTAPNDALGNPTPGPVATTLSQPKPGQTTTLTITHSDVVGASPSTGGAKTTGDPSDIAAFLPVRQFPVDLHEAAGAPTIDAGLTDPLNGPADLDGSLRTSGAATDIGAYEHQVLTVSAGLPPLTTHTPPPLPIAEPKLKMVDSRALISFPGFDGATLARCTGVTLTCTVHGTLKATLYGHHAPSAIGTISGTLHPHHTGDLNVKISRDAYTTLNDSPHLRLDAKTTLTTKSGLGTTKQKFTIRLETEPDYT